MIEISKKEILSGFEVLLPETKRQHGPPVHPLDSGPQEMLASPVCPWHRETVVNEIQQFLCTNFPFGTLCYFTQA